MTAYRIYTEDHQRADKAFLVGVSHGQDIERARWARVAALAGEWMDSLPPSRTDQAHARLDCWRELTAALPDGDAS